MPHVHDVIDDDKYFLIDPDTRMITRTADADPVLIQFDHNSEQFTFNVPQEIDGHDMKQCNKIQVHFINIDVKDTSNTNSNLYEVKPTDVIENDDGTLSFPWLIDQSATLLIGPLNFAISFMCAIDGFDESGTPVVTIEYAWNTKPYVGVVVSDGINSYEALGNKYYDVIDQWYTTITNAGDRAKADALSDINAARSDAVSSVQTTSAEALIAINQSKTGAVSAIDDHTARTLSELTDSDLGGEILSQLAGLRQDVANLGSMSFLQACVPGRIYGGSTNANVVNELTAKGYLTDSTFVLGTNGTYLVSHKALEKISSIKHVIVFSQTYFRGDGMATYYTSVEYDWLYATRGDYMSYTHYILDIEKVENDGTLSNIDSPVDLYPTTPIFMLGQDSVSLTSIPSKFPANGPTNYKISTRSKIVIGGNVCAVDYDSFDEIPYYIPAASSNLDIPMIVASYLIIPASDDIDLQICSINLKDGVNFTVDANGIAGITGPVEDNLEDIYTIVLDDGTTREFKVPNGNSAGIRTSDSGEIVHCEDVIDVEHTVKTNIRSKNLVDLTKASAIQATITPASDGSITIAPATEIYGFRFRQSDVGCFEVGKTYTASIGSVTDHTTNSWGWRLSYADGTYENVTSNKSEVYTFTPSKEVGALQFYVGSPYIGNKEIVITNIQVEEGDTATAYTPYVDVSTAKLTRCGKNLIPYPHAYGSGSVAGITYVSNSDGTITATGTATDNSIHYMILSPNLHLPAGTYTLTGCPAGGGQSTYRLNIKRPGEKYHYDLGEGCTFTLTEDDDIQLYIFIGTGTEVNGLVFKPQLEAADTASAFESYIGVTYSVNSDGTPTERIRSIAPTMNLLTDKAGVIIDATYNVDQTAVYNQISNMLDILLNGGA